MSHRALVALLRDDGRYDVFYAHDAGADDRLDRLRGTDVGIPADLLDGPSLATGLAFDAVVTDHLDPVDHEALIVVDCDAGPDPFVVLPYVLATAEGILEWEPRGVAISLSPTEGHGHHPAFVRGWFQGTAGTLGDVTDAGFLAVDDAFTWLDDAVHRFAGDRHRLMVVP